MLMPAGGWPEPPPPPEPPRAPPSPGALYWLRFAGVVPPLVMAAALLFALSG